MKISTIMRKTLALCLTTAMTGMLFTGCSISEEEEPEQVVWGVKALTEAELANDTVYIKHGDEYYAMGYGDESFGEDCEGEGQKYAVPSFNASSPLSDIRRTIFFKKGEREYNIPTMYKGDQIVFKSSTAIESAFTWERFADGGYTVGLRGLYTSDHDKIEFNNYVNNIAVEDEVLTSNIQTTESKNEKDPNGNRILRSFVLDAIDGQKVTPEIIGPQGYLMGISPSKDSVFDVYDGTNLIQFTDRADFRVFYGLECFWTTGVTYTDNNYAIVTMGDFFKSGYYKLNGDGLFRYVDQPYSEGLDLNTITFNEAFFQYATDENGKVYLDFLLSEDKTRYLYDATEIANEKERRRIEEERKRLAEYQNVASGAGAEIVEQTPLPVQTPSADAAP